MCIKSSAIWRTGMLLVAMFGAYPVFAQSYPTSNKPKKTTRNGPVRTEAAPQWMLDSNIPLAGSCRYPNGYAAINRGKSTNKDPSGHCEENCSQGPLRIDPSPIVGNINQDLAINFRLDQVLGGPNAVCASNGTIDWGDGTQEPMPHVSWIDCDRKPADMLRDTVGKPPNYTLHHTYRTAGEYCVSAQVWGNHKYDGVGSCSYDCSVSANAAVIIRDTAP